MRSHDIIRDDVYWRLNRGREIRSGMKHLHWTLKAANYKPRAHITKSALIELLVHHEKGLLCYDECSDRELKKFVRDRNIARTEETTDRLSLVSMLQADDASRAFHRFSDLPAELRVRIYEFHIADFADTTLYFPVQPPITWASKLARAEALPVFYNTCTFAIALQGRQETRNGHLACYHKLSTKSQLFLHLLKPEQLAAIRHIEIAVEQWERGATRVTTAQIELKPHGREYNITAVPAGRRRELVCEPYVVDELSKVLRGVSERSGPYQLTVDDVWQFRKSIDAAFQ